MAMPGSDKQPHRIPPPVPTWNGSTLPISTVEESNRRAFGRILAGMMLTGIIIGLLLSIAVYIYGLMRLVGPPQPLGDPSYSLKALEALAAQKRTPGDNTGVNSDSPADALVRAQTQFSAVTGIEPRAESGVRNILLISKPLDERSGKIRTEALLVLSINKPAKTNRLIAFDRTMPANIPDKGWSLLGHAATMGGVDLVRQTIAENYRLKINDALVFDFAALARAVDYVGGIDVEVREEEVVFLRQDQPQLAVSVGLNHMNGNLAVAYCQITGFGDHHDQNRRLLGVFEQVFAGAAQLSAIEMKNLAHDILPDVQTTLPPYARYRAMLDIFTTRDNPLTTWAFTTDERGEPGEAVAPVPAPPAETTPDYPVRTLHRFLFDNLE